MADTAGTKVGTGYVAIDADFSPFHKRLEVFRQTFARSTRGLGADIGSQLSPALDGVARRLRATGGEADRLGGSFRGLDNATTAVRRSVDGVGDSLARNTSAAKGFGNELGRVRGATNDAGGGVRSLADHLNAARAAAANARTSLGGFGDDLRGVRAAAQEARSGITPFSTELDVARAKVRQFGDQVTVSSNNTRGSFGGLTDSLRGFRTTATQAEQGNLRLERATYNLQQAVRRYGQGSLQAREAQARLTAEQRRAEQGASLLGRSFTGLGGRTTVVNQRFQLLRNMIGLLKWPAIITGAGLAAQALSALGAAAVAVTAAVGPAVGVLGALPGALTAAAQGFGVFKLATMGVGDALREQLRTQASVDTAAARGADTQRAAARAIAAAQEGVRSSRLGVADAVRRVQDAERGYADSLGGLVGAERAVAQALQGTRLAQLALVDARAVARQQIVDTQAALTDALLSEERATFALRDARDALAALSAAPSVRVLAEAHEAVADAMRGEQQAAGALADAQRALNALLAAPDARDVAAANDRITASLRDERRAVFALTDAQRALQDLLNPPDAMDVADAQDAVADATRDQERSTNALAKATKAHNALLAKRARLEALGATDANLAAAGVSDEDLAESRLALADATNAVGDANRETARAQQALSDVQRPATEQEIAEARLDVADAEAAVEAAKHGTVDAQQALAALEAPASADEIARARMAVANAEDGVADSRQATIDAQTRLVELERPAAAHELAKARLTVREAEDGLADAIRGHGRAAADLIDIEARGVAGSQAVIDARQAIADANEEVAEAQQGVNDAMRAARDAAVGVTDAEFDLAEAKRQVRLALQGVRDAQLDAAAGLDDTAAAAANLNEKFDRLPPAAQAFVRTLLQLKPRFDELRTVAADGFFPGARAGLLEAARNFGPLRTVVSATARALGWLAETAGRLIGSAGFGRDLERIGLRNADVVRRVGHAAILVTDALRHLMVAAGPLLTWLARTAERWGEYLRSSAQAGRESGRLARFFEQTRSVLERLGSITGNVARSFGSIGRAAAPLGREILAALDSASEGFARWTGSIDGQRSLRRYFDDARPAIWETARLVRDVVAAFFRLGNQPGVARLIRQVRTELLPALERTFSVLTSTFGPAIVNAVTQVVRLFAQLAGAGGALSQIVRLLGAVAKGFGWILTNVPGAKELTFALIGMAGALKAIKVVSAISGITLLGRAALGAAAAHRSLAAGTAAVEVATKRGMVATIVARGAMLASAAASKALTVATFALNVAMRAIPIVALVTGLVAIGLGFKEAYEHVAWFRATVDDVVGFVKSNWPFLIGAFTGPLGVAIGLMVRDFDGFVDFVKGMPGRIVAVIKGAPGLLVDAGGWVVDRLVDGAMAAGRLVLDAAGWYLDTLVAGVKAYASAWLSVGGWVLERVVSGFKAVGGGLATVGSWLKDRFVGFVHGTAEAFGSLGQWILARVANGFKTVIETLGNVGEWLKNRIVEFVHGTVESFGELGRWILARVVNGFKTVIELLGTVGGWLKDRIVDTVHGAIEGFASLGQWVLARIVNGFKEVLRDSPITTVGNWLLERMKDFVGAAADGFKGIGGSIIGWIVDGLKAGLKAVGKFLNLIIKAINLIPGVSVDEIDVDKLATGGKMSSAGVDHFATGGEVRRGTVVDKPMIMMGEEAPRHPEFVIPTNPAYRDRARMLLGQAANAIGFQFGGVLRQGVIADLAARQGAPDPALASAVAMAESSGNTQATNYNTNGTVDRGLYQINSIHGYPESQLFNAVGNTTAAKGVSNNWSSWTPWVAYNTGSYQKFLGQGLEDLGSGGGGIGGELGELLSKGWRWITDKFPNPSDMLPDWLVGTGKWVIDKATGWVKDQVGSVIGDIGGNAGLGDPPTYRLARMTNFANVLDRLDVPYGPGAHYSGGWPIFSEEDCSSTASKLAHAAGALDRIHSTVDFAQGAGIAAGPGRWVTFHNRPLPGNEGHIVTQILDRYFATSTGNPGGGPGWTNPDAGYLATMPQKLHPVGLARGGAFGGDGASISPFVGSYARGGRIDETGMALVHEGEEIVPRNEESMVDKIADALRELELVADLGDGIQERVRLEVRRSRRPTQMSYRAGVIG